MNTAIVWIIALAVVIFHIWLCRRSPRYWCAGGIVPIIWFGLVIFLFANDKIDFMKDLKVLIFPTVILLLLWIEGHQAAKKKEINKMKAKDI